MNCKNIISPFERNGFFIWTNSWWDFFKSCPFIFTFSLSSHVRLKLVQCFWRIASTHLKVFNVLLFSVFCFYLPLEKMPDPSFAVIWTPMFGAEFGWNWHDCPGEDNFKNSTNFHHFATTCTQVRGSYPTCIFFIKEGKFNWKVTSEFWWRRFSTIVTCVVCSFFHYRIFISRLKGAYIFI